MDLFEILGEKLDKFKQEDITLSTFINPFATGNLAVRLLLKLWLSHFLIIVGPKRTKAAQNAVFKLSIKLPSIFGTELMGPLICWGMSRR